MELLTWIKNHNGGILEGLVAALLFAFFGWALKSLWDLYQQRRLKKVWKPFIGSDVTIVFGDYGQYGNLQQDWDLAGMMGIGDTMALAAVNKALEKIKPRSSRIYPARKTPVDALSGKLILIGGPDVNTITAEIFEKIQSSFEFAYRNGDIFIKDKIIKNKEYHSCATKQPGPGSYDYGLLLLANNPNNKNKKVMIIAGNFGYGSWICGESVADPKFLLSKKLKNIDPTFEMILKTNISAGGWPQTPEIIEYRKLN